MQYVNDECWKITGIHLKNCLFGQTTKQPLSNFEPENFENTSNFDDWALTLVAYKIKIN